MPKWCLYVRNSVFNIKVHINDSRCSYVTKEKPAENMKTGADWPNMKPTGKLPARSMFSDQ